MTGEIIRILDFFYGRKSPKMVQYVMNGMDEIFFVSEYILQLLGKEELEEFLIKEVKEFGV